MTAEREREKEKKQEREESKQQQQQQQSPQTVAQMYYDKYIGLLHEFERLADIAIMQHSDQLTTWVSIKRQSQQLLLEERQKAALKQQEDN